MATMKIDVMANLLNWSVQIMANIGELFQNPIVIKSRSIDGLWQSSHCKLVDENFKLFLFFSVKQVPFDVPMSDNNGFYRPLCRSVTVRFALNVCLHAHCACVCVHYSKGMIGMHALSKLVVLLSSVFLFFAPFALTLFICLSFSLASLSPNNQAWICNHNKNNKIKTVE